MTYPQMTAPNGLWMKTHIWQDGEQLRARTFMVVAGEPTVFEVSVNLRLIDTALRKYHAIMERDLHKTEAGQISGCVGCEAPIVAGLFGSIAKTVKKVGKSKLVRKVASTAKRVINNKVTRVATKTIKKVSKPVLRAAERGVKAARPVVKSKAVGAVAAGLAVAFPPVGVPAAAAYAGANAALAAIERGGAIRKAALGVLAKAKKLGVKPKLSATVKKRVATAFKTEKFAKKQIQKIALAARTSSDPRTKAEAQKMLGVLSVAQKSRQRIKSVPVQTPTQIKAATKRANAKVRTSNSAQLRAKALANRARSNPTVSNQVAARLAAQEALKAKVTAVKAQDEVIRPSARAQGLIVTETGLIVPGTFNELPLGGVRAKFYQRRGHGLSGNYQQIAGCIGCDDGDDVPAEFGECVGCDSDELSTNIPVSGWPLLP